MTEAVLVAGTASHVGKSTGLRRHFARQDVSIAPYKARNTSNNARVALTPAGEGPIVRPLGPESAATGRVLGTYLHGLFENPAVREALARRVLESGQSGPHRIPHRCVKRSSPYARATDLVADHVDLSGTEPIP